MEKCRSADRYQAKLPPKCNGGRGCLACNAKFDAAVTPPEIKCDYLFLDVKIGRDTLRKLVGERTGEGRYNVPIVITGFVVDGNASGDDGISQEFTVEVADAKLGKPVLKAPHDKMGRRYALAANVREGDTLIPDDGFTCMKAGTHKKVRAWPDGQLYVPCKCGGHGLDGQLGYTPETEGAYVGFYPHRKAA